jgi:arginase family enzyme
LVLSDIALTVFQGRAGDHNNLAIPAAAAIGAMLSERLGLRPTVIGTPELALNTNWKPELEAAMPTLKTMAAHYDDILGQGFMPLTALSRCAVALATLPVVAKHRPDAKVVWFDSHADLNTPETTSTGYLGGLALAGAAGLWDSGLGGYLDPANIILVGVRDIDPAEQALIDAGVVHLIPPHADLASELKEAIAGSPVYVHLDCDVLNPGIVPTDYQHEDGLTLADLHAAAEAIAESEVVGVEIAELQNAWEDGGEPVSPAILLDALRPLISRVP